MQLVVGLGNPGEQYQNTRHNAGHMFIDGLQKLKLPKDVIARKSDVFMNESGRCINVLIHEYKVDLPNLYIVHDDLDIRLGEYKIQFGRGPKDHNGIKSVDEEIGTDQYWHVRIGIDNRQSLKLKTQKSNLKISGEQYVLENFREEERKILDKTIKLACKKLATLLQNTN